MENLNKQEKKIVDDIMGQAAIFGKIKPEDAAKALKSSAIRKWLEDRERTADAGFKAYKGINAEGGAVQDEKYNDRVVVCWMYDNYLRMAQMDQRSDFSVEVVEGKEVKRPIIKMTFDEFLVDSLKRLDWIENEDIPMKRKLMLESPLGPVYGVTSEEADFSLALVRKLRESIKKYLKMPEQEKLVYATDAVLFE